MTNESDRSSRPIWLGEDRRTWDHARIHLQLLHDERIGAHEIAVYVGLVAHAETQSGRCFPAVSTLAKYAGISESTVQRTLKVLLAAGYIDIERSKGKANTYRILPPPTPVTLTGVGTNPSHTDRGPQSHRLGTPVTVTDELEPLTRTINQKRFSTGSNSKSSEQTTSRFPEPRPGCTECDGGWVLNETGTAVACSCETLPAAMGTDWTG